MQGLHAGHQPRCDVRGATSVPPQDMICELVKLNRVQPVRKVLRVLSPFGQEDFSPFSGPSYGNELSQFAALNIGMQIVLAKFWNDCKDLGCFFFSKMAIPEPIFPRFSDFFIWLWQLNLFTFFDWQGHADFENSSGSEAGIVDGTVLASNYL